MNSPYHALTVFTKFMASPTDALEIIAKCVNSPADVLQFIQQLMVSPNNAIEIVNKFMNSSSGEAMKMLNDMVDITMVDSTTTTTTKMESSDLSNLLASSESATEVRPAEIMPNDIVADTLYYTKEISSPTVQHLLQSVHGESTHGDTKRSEQCGKDSDDTGMNERPNTLQAIISDAIKIEYNWNSKESNVNRELNDSETAKLNELIVAYKALFVPLDEDITPLSETPNKVHKSIFLFFKSNFIYLLITFL